MKFAKFVLMFCTILLVGCTHLTEENFAQVKPGMTMNQVVAILGEPTTVESMNFLGLSGTKAIWKNKNVIITILFMNEQVSIKSFEKNGEKVDIDAQEQFEQ